MFRLIKRATTALTVTALAAVVATCGSSVPAMALSTKTLGDEFGAGNVRIQYTDEADEQSSVYNMCNGNARVGFGGYVSNPQLSYDSNSDELKITWTMRIFHKKCSDSSFTRLFAITGYPTSGNANGLCPVAGWWEAGIGDGAEIHDCVKYQSDFYDGADNCGNGNFTNTCSGNGGSGWWSKVKAGNTGDQPTTAGSWTSFDFSATLSNWSEKAKSDGSYEFATGYYGDYYWIDTSGTRGDGHTQWITGVLYWEAKWDTAGATKVKTDTEAWPYRTDCDSNCQAKERTGIDAITNARPTDVVWWKHGLWASEGTITKDINVSIQHLTIKDGIWTVSSSSCIGNNGCGPYGRTAKAGTSNAIFYWVGNNGQTDSHAITQDDVGLRVCSRAAWAPHSNGTNGSDTIYTDVACAYTPYHYPDCEGNKCTEEDDPPKRDCTFYNNCPGDDNDDKRKPKSGATPTTTMDRGANETIMVGDSVTFTYTASNVGPTKSKSINYKSYVFVLRGDSSLPDNSGSDIVYNMDWGSNGVGCGGRSVGSGETRKCENTGSGSVVVTPGTNTGDLGQITITVGENGWNVQPGDQICSYVALDNNWNVFNDVSSSTYLASNISCVRVGKRVQMQINGADSYAKYGFTGTSYSSKWTTRGSYSQYGLLTGSSSNANITSFGSAGFSTNGGDSSKRLAFANASSILGNAGLNKELSAVRISQGRQRLTSSTVDLSTLSAGTYYYSGNNQVVINGANLSNGQNITIYVLNNGRGVKINGNITMNGSYNSLSSLPNLIIVAESGDIEVSANVTSIAGVYATKDGAFRSCAESTEAAGANDSTLGISDSGVCKNKLVINGAILSSESPELRRTFGGGNDGSSTDQWNNDKADSTSEWFNYTPNLWLSAYLSGSGNVNNYTTTYVTSLPVRY